MTKHLFLVFMLLGFSSAYAGDGRTRVQLSLGGGQASSKSADGTSAYAEGPMAFGAGLDYQWTDSTVILVEHLRSFGGGSTSSGFSGIGAKYYPWLTPLNSQMPSALDRSAIAVSGYAYYVGGVAGIAQTSAPGSATVSPTISVGPYMGAKGGMEMRLSRDWCLAVETNLDLTLGGSGSAQFMNVVVGAFYSL